MFDANEAHKQTPTTYDDHTTILQANSFYAIPKESILNDQNLTDIEKTMIIIYTPATKYSLCTKVCATSYTIINDSFIIANQLPNKIDPSTIGILQTISRKLYSNSIIICTTQ